MLMRFFLFNMMMSNTFLASAIRISQRGLKKIYGKKRYKNDHYYHYDDDDGSSSSSSSSSSLSLSLSLSLLLLLPLLLLKPQCPVLSPTANMYNTY